MSTRADPGAPPPDHTAPGTTAAPGSRKRYEPPRLTCYGDVRGITLGGTIGVGDSGNPFAEQAPGGPGPPPPPGR